MDCEKVQKYAESALEEMSDHEINAYFLENVLLNDKNEIQDWLSKVDMYIPDKAYYFLEQYHLDALQALITFSSEQNQSMVNEYVCDDICKSYGATAC